MMMQRIDHIFIKLLSVLAQHNTISEDELANHFNLSIRTIQRYLVDLESIIKQLDLDLDLNKTDRKNIHLVGNRNKLALVIQKMNRLSFNEALDRIAIMVNQLLQATEPLTLQYFADYMHIGKTTAEKTLQEAREYVARYKVRIDGSRKGLVMHADENQTRKILADLIRIYWSGIKLNLDNNVQHLDISMNVQTDSLLNQTILQRVQMVVNKFINAYQIDITEYQYQSLIIHISIAIDRIQGASFYETRKPIENIHDFTLKLVKLLEEAFDLSIPRQEYYYLNLHIETILNLPIEANQVQTNDLEYGKVIRQVLVNHLAVLDPDDTLLTNLSIHLNTSLKRIKQNSKIQNPHKEYVKNNFTRAFNLAVDIALELSELTHLIFNVDEITYIAIHIQSFFERKTNQYEPIKAILVCASGFGTVKLLEQRLMQHFYGQLTILDTIGLNELSKIRNKDVLIISTIPIESRRADIIYVNPLLTEPDIKTIDKYIADYHHKHTKTTNHYLDSNLIFFSKGIKENHRTVIEFMCSQLIYRGYAEVGLLESVLKREELASTAMGLFALPHGDTRYVNKSVIGAYYNPNGIYWNGQKVYIAFFMAINPADQLNLKKLYSDFNYFISQDDFKENIQTIKNKEELITFLTMKGR